jgi:hypothetical protein
MKKTLNLKRICFLLGLWFLFSGPFLADKKKKEPPPAPTPYALLEASCFNSQGLSLSGVSAEVTIKANPGEKPSKHNWRAVSSPRGEWALRLPPGPITFVVRVKREGFQPQEKEVTFTLDERQDIVFNLEPVRPGH